MIQQGPPHRNIVLERIIEAIQGEADRIARVIHYILQLQYHPAKARRAKMRLRIHLPPAGRRNIAPKFP